MRISILVLLLSVLCYGFSGVTFNGVSINTSYEQESVSIEWLPPDSDNAEGYRIYTADTQTGFIIDQENIVADVGAHILEYTFEDGLEDETWITVTAYNGGGESGIAVPVQYNSN